MLTFDDESLPPENIPGKGMLSGISDSVLYSPAASNTATERRLDTSNENVIRWSHLRRR